MELFHSNVVVVGMSVAPFAGAKSVGVAGTLSFKDILHTLPLVPALLLVPAKRFVPLMARDQTVGSVRPLFEAVQLVPLLVDRNTPFPSVPA